MKAKSFLVLGLGRFGRSLAETLHNMGYDVLAVDKDEEAVNSLPPAITYAVVGDVTDENMIKSLGVGNFDAAVVAVGGEIHSSVLLTLILKEEGVKYIVARAQSELHSKVLNKVGADRIIFPEKDMGVRVANNLVSTNILELIELSSEHSIVEIIPPSVWIGKSIKESNIRAKYGVSIMAVKKDSSVKVAPTAEYIIMDDDNLVIIGRNENINKIGSME